MIVVKLPNWERAMGDLWIYVVALSIVYVLYILRNYIRTMILAFKLRGPPTLPIVGSSHLLFDNNAFNMVLKECQVGAILKVWISIIPFIVAVEPKDIQAVLGSSKHNSKSFIYTLFRSFFGDGLIISEMETWKSHRKIIHLAFNNNGLEKFIKIFAKYAESLSLEFFDKLDEDINITKMINNVIYNIQSESILGLRTKKDYTNEEEEDALPFKKYVSKLRSGNMLFAPYRLLRPWLLINWVYNMTMTSKVDSKQLKDHANIVDRILKETKESMGKNSSGIEHEENGKGTKEWASFLEYMLEMKEKYPQLTDDEIVAECGTFMLAGMESVSTATAITLFLLANHKEWQEKCVNELNEILNDDDDTTFTSTKALKEMKCLEMCIKETLRLYPSVPIISRRLSEDEKLGGHVVPAGCKIFISPFITHRLPHYYPDPESFKPERFDPANSDEKVHPYAYIPFSGGPRNCIGYKFAMLEIKVLVSTILRNFVLEPVEGKNVVHLRYRMTLRAHGGLWIKFKARQKQ